MVGLECGTWAYFYVLAACLEILSTAVIELLNLHSYDPEVMKKKIPFVLLYHFVCNHRPIHRSYFELLVLFF